MTSQQYTELSAIKERLLNDYRALEAEYGGDAEADVKEIMEALTSWKDKEVIKELTSFVADLNDIGPYEPLPGTPRDYVNEKFRKRVESLQSQGGKNE